MPQPKVASAVINLKVLKEPKVKAENEKLFFKIVKSAFGQRRKTLVNALTKSPYINLSKDSVIDALEVMGMNFGIRGERLSVEEFVELSNILNKA